MKNFFVLLFIFITTGIFAQVSSFDKGLDAHNAGDYNSAIDHYSDYIKTKHSANAYFNRGLSFYKNNEYIGAIEDFTIVIDMDPEDYEAWYNRGLAYYESGEFKKAYFDSEKAIQLNPEYGNSYTTVGLCYYEWKKYDKAITSFTEGISFDKTANKFYNRALAYQKIEDYVAAEKDYNSAINLREDVDYYWGRADMFYELGKYDDCIKDYNTTIEMEDSISSLYYNRGLAYYAKEDDELAIEDFHSALAIDSNDIDAKWYLALSHYSLKNYEESLKYYNKAEKQDSFYSYLSGLDKDELERKATIGNNFWYIIALAVLAILALVLFSKLFLKKDEPVRRFE